MDQFEGSMITRENSSVARESSRVIILKSRLNSTGHSACTSEVRDIFDRQTHVPNDRWQLMYSRVLQPWDRRNSTTAPVRNYYYYYYTPGEFFKPALADGLSLESEWQQISSGLRDSSQYSQQCFNQDGFDSSSDFQLFQSSFSNLWGPF